MLSFKQHMAEASVAGKNLHMTHLEDAVLYGGVDGTRDAILALRSLRDMLAGNSKGAVDVTVKWDGAPAVFCGVDPSDGQFFVAKKGVFNKTPKLYKTNSEIDNDLSGELNSKFKVSQRSLILLFLNTSIPTIMLSQFEFTRYFSFSFCPTPSIANITSSSGLNKLASSFHQFLFLKLPLVYILKLYRRKSFIKSNSLG